MYMYDKRRETLLSDLLGHKNLKKVAESDLA